MGMSSAWNNVGAAANALEKVAISNLFSQNPTRTESFMFQAGDLLVDFSRQKIDSAALQALVALAKHSNVENLRNKMFSGEAINNTEDRPVLHVALRMPASESVVVAGENIIPEVHATLDRMAKAAERIASGTHVGATGKPIKHVVNIGIGGSDLGPAMAMQALVAYGVTGVQAHFVSNVDPTDLARVLANLNPQETAFVVASKTFTTQETMANAHTAMKWLQNGMNVAEVQSHFFAVTARVDAAVQFGIAAENVFPMWDWVGGRFSLGSAIGFSLMCSIGAQHFGDMLLGMREMDEHFCSAELHENVPVLLALVGIWNRNFLGCASQAVIPYLQELARFPAYLQQLEMESNGKRANRAGELVEHETSPVVWGEPGTNGQHAFFQLLHQGTDVIPVDFIGAARTTAVGLHEQSVREQHQKLMANMFAQASALAFGSPAATDIPAAQGEHRVFPGNRPSTTIVFNELNPRVLGQLVALYEHKTFVQGCIWGVNSFDQWGVELGKVLAGDVLAHMANTSLDSTLDHSTRVLVEWFLKNS
jgi:glucose-6-phosphate isomerase